MVYCWVLSEVYYLKYFMVMVFSWLFLQHDDYIYLCSVVCYETDSGYKVLDNDVGLIFEHEFHIGWALVKLGFVKCLLNVGHYKRVDVRS